MRIATLAVLGALALAAPAGAVGVPTTFPRTIASVNSAQGIDVARFEAAARTAGSKVRVTVRVAATSITRSRKLVIAVGPCTAGPTTSPLCKPTAKSVVAISKLGTSATRTLTVARPAKNPDALRVTLTESTHPIPFLRERVGGGGGTAELLLNGGTWRYRQGTRWGITASPLEGVTLSRISFNSRTYAWSGTSGGDLPVSTKIGYEGQTPRWTFANTMKAGVPFRFDRTPSVPIYSARTAPRALSYRAELAGQPLFTVRVPLPKWHGGL